MKVLVTGGAGYVGSHIVYELIDRGHEVAIMDTLRSGDTTLIHPDAEFHNDDISMAFRALKNVDVVVNCAASSIVSESVYKPLEYWNNNVCRTHDFITQCVDMGVKKFIQSSSAAVYGNPNVEVISEATETKPINPYGSSKLAIEMLLENLYKCSVLNYNAFRYFNVAGADPQMRIGEITHTESTHLIKTICEHLTGQREEVPIYGTSYNTPDGTCIRDFVHVSDLAKAHVLAVENNISYRIMNVGYGRGYSVRDVIKAAERVSHKQIKVTETMARPGDPPRLVCDNSILLSQSWHPEFDDIETMITHALQWEKRVITDHGIFT